MITFDASKELTDQIALDEGSYQLPECHNSKLKSYDLVPLVDLQTLKLHCFCLLLCCR